MQVCTIGYGRSTVHDFESSDFRECCYMEATLESWEDVDESLGVLRERVCLKVGISEDIDALERRRQNLQNEISKLDLQIETTRKKWQECKAFSEKIQSLIGENDPIPF